LSTVNKSRERISGSTNGVHDRGSHHHPHRLPNSRDEVIAVWLVEINNHADPPTPDSKGVLRPVDPITCRTIRWFHNLPVLSTSRMTGFCPVLDIRIDIATMGFSACAIACRPPNTLHLFCATDSCPVIARQHRCAGHSIAKSCKTMGKTPLRH